MGGILLVLMLFSTVGYAFSDKGDSSVKSVNYEGIEYKKLNSDYWIFEINNNEFITKYNPTETKDILVLTSLNLESYQGKPLYVVGNNNEPISEIARNLESFTTRIQKACIDNCTEDLPIKNCTKDNVIIFKESSIESIYQQENCIFINSEIQNQTKFADAFLFEVLTKV